MPSDTIVSDGSQRSINGNAYAINKCSIIEDESRTTQGRICD
jgi:hypothetical protein